MSQLDPRDVQIQMNWTHYVGLMQIVILIYDWFLTLDQEVELIWQCPSKTRLPVILFFSNRYLTLLGNIPITVLFFWSKPINSDNPELGSRYFDFYVQTLLALVQLNIFVLFTLRVTALYGGSGWIKLFLFVLGLAVTCNSIVHLALADRQPFVDIKTLSVLNQIGNIPIFTTSQGLDFTFVWVGNFIFDLCVFSLTVWRTIDIYRSTYIQGGIGTVIIRDGLMYFGIITLVTLGNLLVFVLGTELLKGLLTIPSNSLSSLLMSHMMLNLREDNEYTMNHSVPTQLSEILFN
ncbi:hypothetical protein GYMLUDRAFT_40417 [Collybiopsis luxurians FD-317 M1]|uniref:DUF6533 domain-containing protein n=1 Tax=Collybiopsis luxurians FD-317 M1 TaxID=944289 RepID=A0A0D0C7J0_9AGAR|nr:hypothetical protein GYMLUDRAFT_40417 [Collybiopsis luxurians FD-317 M1]